MRPRTNKHKINTSPQPSSTGFEEKKLAALAYATGVLPALLLLFIEKRSAFVRFHAMQAVLLSSLTLALLRFPQALSLHRDLLNLQGASLALPPRTRVVLYGLVFVASIVSLLRMLCAIKAYENIYYSLPLLGQIASSVSKNTGNTKGDV